MRLISAVPIVVAACLAAAAQEPDAPGAARPAFEVASVKPNTSGSGSMSMDTRGDQFTAVNSPLRLLLQSAYGFRDAQLLGPAWIDSERFDIAAKAAGGAAPAQKSVMLQTLLEDRFRLVVRRETRQMPVYALVLARADRRLGPALRPSETDCRSGRGTPAVFGAGAGLPSAGARPPCGTVSGGTRVAGGSVTMAALASTLIRLVDRVVVDRTELSGTFDFDMKWAPDTGPSIFTAIQEQLGLRLEAGQGPVEVMVIESIERPTPD